MAQFYGKKTGIKNILLLPLVLVVLGVAVLVVKLLRLSSDQPVFSEKIINNANADVPADCAFPGGDCYSCGGTACCCDCGGEGGGGGGEGEGGTY